MKDLRFIDLFCGLGGFRIALEQKGWKCVFSSDINKYTKEVYKLNFNEYPHDDITKIHENDIPEHDILCGGFPCQTFSTSGSKNGLNDKRGQLIHEIIRIAKHRKPKILLLENVKGLKILENGKNLKYILNLIEESGYIPNYYLLNSKDYNVPQNRERIYFVCIRKDLTDKIKTYEPIKENKFTVISDILDNEIFIPSNLFTSRKNVKKWSIDIKKIPFIEKNCELIKIGSFTEKETGRQGNSIYSINGIAPTVMSSNIIKKCGQHIMYDDKIRMLTINEVRKIMDFPESYELPFNIKSYQALGNAVIPSMIKRIIDNIIFE